MRPLFVCAGNINEFRAYCDDHDIKRGGARYIHSREDIIGVDPRKIKVVFYGTYHERPDYKEITGILDRYYGRMEPK